MTPHAPTPATDQRPVLSPAPDPVQRRTLTTLMTSQILGGVGLSGGVAVGSLLAEQILGSAELAGLANTFQILGSAVLAVPGARLMAARGRRIGLATGYLVAAVGGVTVIAASVIPSFPLLLAGAILFGAATTANSQARYAAVDLSHPNHRGRDLGLIVAATTVGAVLGPNLLAPAAPLATRAGLNPLVGVWMISLVVFLTAAIWLLVRLRPDPLLLARQRASRAGDAANSNGGFLRAWRVISGRPRAAVGTFVVALGHTVMVAVMVMTPLHMKHGGSELRLVGLVISVHVLGMYAFAPVMGRLADRHGDRQVAVLGAGLLLLACVLSAQAPQGWSGGLTAGLFLLGLGWSATLVAGSTMLTSAVPAPERPGVQGASDLLMGLCAALGGGLSGVVVARWGYPWLSVVGAFVATGLAAVVLLSGSAVRGDPADNLTG
ncbi:MAG TPA: MFS transporter [Dermatophilaceae bacterium]|nr:MFS transporter [Dermatophilaceae bacterium]